MQCALGFIAGSILVWKIGRLTSTSLSSCEGEWFAQTCVGTLQQALMPVAKFFGVDAPLPIISFCDNDAAITLSVGDTSTKRMKHIATRMHYLLELTARDKALLILHLETKGMIADIGTKPLLPAQFHFLRRFLVWE